MSWTKLITAGFITEMNDQVSGGMEIKKTNKQKKKNMDFGGRLPQFGYYTISCMTVGELISLCFIINL